jgi:ABC-type multidrug transport system ATPase subunit
LISVELNNLGKKFKSEWVFRKINYHINESDRLVILGNNGSGKSTLLQMISGYVSYNEGEIIYKNAQALIPEDSLHQHISFASPYLQLIEEFTLLELVEHCRIAKPFFQNLSAESFINELDLKSSTNKLIKQFSSGMKQRLKLGLAIFADTQLLLLDEPISNLDERSIDWYQNQLRANIQKRTLVICSNNIKLEHFMCDKTLNVMDYKN